MIDEYKNDYFPINGEKNILYEVAKGSGYTNQSFIVQDQLALFVDTLSVKRPRWKFVARTSPTSICLFQVYEKGERVGTISIGKAWNNGAYVNKYIYTNARIVAAATRTHEKKTGDLNKAVKDVLKYFSPKTLNEYILERRAALANGLGGLTTRVNGAVNQSRYRLSDPLINFFIDNFEELAPRAKAAGVLFPDNLPELRENSIQGTAMMTSFSSGTGTKVYIRDDEYILDDGGATRILPHDKVSNKVRTAVGMLKLLEDGSIAPGVGVKLDSTTFFILDKDE